MAIKKIASPCVRPSVVRAALDHFTITNYPHGLTS